jgi:hypothetical protein
MFDEADFLGHGRPALISITTGNLSQASPMIALINLVFIPVLACSPESSRRRIRVSYDICGL